MRFIRQLSLVRLNQAWFKSSYTGPPVFSNPITFNLDSSHIILGPAKSEFLQVLAGKYLAIPASGRSSIDEVCYVDFNENSRDKVYLSARYESYSSQGTLESENVNSVKNYIMGANNYNSNQQVDLKYVENLIKLFNLGHLSDKWINSLSNGQLRRARLAKALIAEPKLLIIDDLFLGLDPTSSQLVSQCLQKLAITVVIGMRNHDQLPSWIDEVKYVDYSGISPAPITPDVDSVYKRVKLQEITPPQLVNEQADTSVAHLEFVNATIQYSSLKIISELDWKIYPRTKWRILGDNGTGKTSLLSIITGDHPQSYKGIVKIKGKLRKPGDGLTFFELNNHIGISSPELHSLVPPNKTMHQVITNGLVKDVGNSNFMYQYQGQLNQHAQDVLSRFSSQLATFGNVPFQQLSMTLQKLTLFLRSVIKQPEILILDEAFSSMNDVEVMEKCHQLVDELDMTVLIIGHLEWELPRYDYVIQLMGDDARNYKFYQVAKQ